MQIYVSTFRLENYPVREEDILHTGVEAFAAALNTVNVGKFNLCSCSIGMTEHAFYEAITHAQNRILYGNPVTDFSHVRANFVDAYSRLVAMKLFSQRSVDYFRSASLDDRRYLLFNPMTKAKVTMEGETVLRALHDVIAAKGYEKNTMFREVAQLIGTLPRLEGTVHVNVGLVLKFMPNYMLNPAEYPEIPTRNDPADDAFFWNQGPTRGAGKVQFADWTPVYEAHAQHPERRAVLRAGAGIQAAARHRRPRRGAAEGSGLPAQRRAPVLADRLRAADPGAGRVDGCWTTTSSIRSSTSRSATSARMPLRCTASRARRRLSRTGPSARSASRWPTPSASTGSGSGSRPTTAPTRCVPDAVHP